MMSRKKTNRKNRNMNSQQAGKPQQRKAAASQATSTNHLMPITIESEPSKRPGEKTKRRRQRKQIPGGKAQFRFTLLLMLLVLLTLAYFLLPELLKFPIINSFIEYYIFPLRDISYKAEYFSAVGSMIGGLLAAFAAIWIQKRSEYSERKSTIRKYATIVYYDLYFFAMENGELLYSFAKQAQDEKSAQTATGTTENNTQTSVDTSRYLASINESWINDVAELASVLSNEHIQTIYRFYGSIVNTTNYIKTSTDTNKQSVNAEVILQMLEPVLCFQVSNTEPKVSQSPKCMELMKELLIFM